MANLPHPSCSPLLSKTRSSNRKHGIMGGNRLGRDNFLLAKITDVGFTAKDSFVCTSHPSIRVSLQRSRTYAILGLELFGTFAAQSVTHPASRRKTYLSYGTSNPHSAGKRAPFSWTRPGRSYSCWIRGMVLLAGRRYIHNILFLRGQWFLYSAQRTCGQ